MTRRKLPIPGHEIICHTCIYGPGGNGKLGCEAESPIMSRGMTNIIVCNHYTDVLTAETKPERPLRDN